MWIATTVTCIIGNTLIISATFLAQVYLWNASNSSHVGWWFVGSPSLEKGRALESVLFSRFHSPQGQTETQTWEISLLQGHNKCDITSSHKQWTFKDILLQCNGRLYQISSWLLKQTNFSFNLHTTPSLL